MKALKTYKQLLWLLVIPIMMVTCLSIESVIHPADPKASQEIEIVVNMKVDHQETRTNKVVFGILAPKAWDLAANATVTLVSSDLGVTGTTLKLMPADETATGELVPWTEAFMSRFGQRDRAETNNIGGNFGDGVEWVVFETEDQYTVSTSVTGSIIIKFTPNNDNVKVMMAYAFCGKEKGLDDNGYYAKILEVTGGDGPQVNYMVKQGAKIFETIPSVFRYGDIFSVNFDSAADELGRLITAKEVYLYAKAVYNGTEEAIVPRTLMKKKGDTEWQTYLYPPTFFGLPAGTAIDGIYFHFENEDGSIVIDDSGSDFFAEQSVE